MYLIDSPALERLTTPHKPGATDSKGTSLQLRPGEAEFPLHMRTNLEATGGGGFVAAAAMARGVKREREEGMSGVLASETGGEPDEDCDPINGLRKRKKPQLVTGFSRNLAVFQSFIVIYNMVWTIYHR